MTKYMLQLFLSVALLFGFSGPARAGSGADGAGAILISFVAAKGVTAIGMNALESLELEEWRDERSRTTAVLGDTCGFYYEARVIGDLTGNYLWLSLKNNNPTTKSFNPIEVEFKFSDGIERRPDLFRFNEVFFEPGRLYNMILPFPAKEDFKNQQSLNVTIPLYGEGKRCELPLKLLRNPKVPDTLKSTLTLTLLEADVSAGGTLISGNLQRLLGKGSSTSSFNFLLYGSPNSGLYFGFKTYNDKALSADLATQEGYASDWQARMAEFYFGYAHRFIVTRDTTWFLRGGIGGASLMISDAGHSVQDRFGSSTFNLQGGYQSFFSRQKAGIWRGNYYWGLQLQNSYVFASEAMKNGTKFDGNALSALVMIGVGL